MLGPHSEDLDIGGHDSSCVDYSCLLDGGACQPSWQSPWDLECRLRSQEAQDMPPVRSRMWPLWRMWPPTHGSLRGEQEDSGQETAKMMRISEEVEDDEWPKERGPWVLRIMEVDWPENVEAVEPKEDLYNYSISLRSLYLWCDMSTSFIFKTSYLAVLPWNIEIFCINLYTI